MSTTNIAHLVATVREQINRFINQELRKRNVEGLFPSHGGILFHLYNVGKASMKNLAEEIDRDKSTVTALVDKLSALGYVEKAVSCDDQRVVYVTLTQKGLDLRPVFQEISALLLDTISRGVTGKELEGACRVLHGNMRGEASAGGGRTRRIWIKAMELSDPGQRVRFV